MPPGYPRATPPHAAPAGANMKRLAIVFALLCIGFGAGPLYQNLRGNLNKDYDLWYQVGNQMRAGQSVYPPPDGRHIFPFMYPPSAAALLAVLSVAGSTVLVLGFVLAHCAAWAGSVLISVKLATGRALGGHRLLYLVPSIAIIPLIYDIYMLGQPNLFLLLLLLLAFLCLRSGREVSAGALVATAAAIKAFPLLALPYLVYRRYIRASVATVVVLAAWLLVAPAAFRPAREVVPDLAVWARGMLLKYDEHTIAQRPERAYSFKNQSIMSVAHRLLRDVLANGEDDRTWKVNLASLPFHAVSVLILAGLLGLGIYYLFAMGPKAGRTPRGEAIEWAMLTLLITIASPLSFNYAYVWMIFPLTLALQLTLEAPAVSVERRRRSVWIGSVLLLPAFAVGAPMYAQAYGNLFFPALILFFGLGQIARQKQRQPVETSPARGPVKAPHIPLEARPPARS